MNDKLRFAAGLYRGAAGYYDRYGLPYLARALMTCARGQPPA
jgi:hypothetical protein